MELHIVNEHPKYPPVKLIEPTTLGDIHLAAVVQPRQAPFMPIGREKGQLIAQVSRAAA